MYQQYLNKSSFMTNTPSTGFGGTASTFGQTATNAPMFSAMPPTNMFQSPSNTSFNAGPSTQSGFGSTLFGQQPQQQQQQQQPSTSSLFGNSNGFGQNKSTFGFGGAATTQQTSSLFGQQQQSSQPAASSLFQPNAAQMPFSAASSTSFGGAGAHVGTVIKFSPVTGSDTMQKNGVAQSISTKHHCITCMKEYENKSLEELRFEDYSCNRKGPQQQTGFGGSTTPFGAANGSAAATATSLFPSTDHKLVGFGQQSTSFGQTSTFGQGTSTFGAPNTTNTSTLFKPTGFGTPTANTSAFGFNTTPAATNNPFTASQPAKPFSQPLFAVMNTTPQQPQSTTFGTTVFGQGANQNVTSSLFQKTNQPSATGFNTAQSGFSFNQGTASQQPNTLFPASKPSTGFGIFGQPNSTTAPMGQSTTSAFGNNSFAKPASTFAQPNQISFGNNTLGGGLQPQQQQPLFGTPATKSTQLFGNNTSSLFSTSMQPTSNPFTLNTVQQQSTSFPPDPTDNAKNLSLMATDLFPFSPHLVGLEPLSANTNQTTTNPKDLKAILDREKEKVEQIQVGSKLAVDMPKLKRGRSYNREFFETPSESSKVSTRNSHRCLIIRKFNDNPTPLYDNYNSEVVNEADTNKISVKVTKPPETLASRKEIDKARGSRLKLQFDSTTSESVEQNHDEQRETLDDDEVSFAAHQSDLDLQNVSSASRELLNQSSTVALTITENTAGVILTKPEYYIFPALKDLEQFTDANGDCMVQGLTIGRKGYGNIYFPDTINITNMNFDELVHFRHREVIVYPDETKKPPINEGLNRRAQVTLDKIYPREKDSNSYVTNVEHLIQTNFADKLMQISVKHKCRFVEYRPETGSWVFKVDHFSKYGFTESDEEETISDLNRSNSNKLFKTPVQHLKTNEMERSKLGLGGVQQDVTYDSKEAANFAGIESMDTISYGSHIDGGDWSTTKHLSLNAYSDNQTYKSHLFTNLGSECNRIEDTLLNEHLDATKNYVRLENADEEGFYEAWTVDSRPKVYTLTPFNSMQSKDKLKISSLRCCTDMGIFKANSYKTGWLNGGRFYNVQFHFKDRSICALHECSIFPKQSDLYEKMMPSMPDIFNGILDLVEVDINNENIPTLMVGKDQPYLETMTVLFNKHVADHSLSGKEIYLANVFNLCDALWGRKAESLYDRRRYFSDWLTNSVMHFSNDKLFIKQHTTMDHKQTETEIFEVLFKMLTFNDVNAAAQIAMKHEMYQLSLIISQLSTNERIRSLIRQLLDSYSWKSTEVIPDYFKKLHLLLCGTPWNGHINICDGLDWLRCLGLHMWYVGPTAAPLHAIINMYRKSFEEEYATPPRPPYCDDQLGGDTEFFDLFYHILLLYSDNTYQLCQLLIPQTHTENSMDYRFSWLMLQVFLSLGTGLVRETEEEYLHINFSNQLENEGEWKWAIFVLLFLRNNVVKKNLIMKILHKHLLQSPNSKAVEKILVSSFKVPQLWIYEVKAIEAKNKQRWYYYFKYCTYMNNWNEAHRIFVKHMLPFLYVNGHEIYLQKYISLLEPKSSTLHNWKYMEGLVSDFLKLQSELHYDDGRDYENEDLHHVESKLISLCEKLSFFSTDTTLQKLCIAEISRKCAFLLKIISSIGGGDSFFACKFNDILNASLIMPPDYKYFEKLYVINDFAIEKA